ncbi:protein FAM170A-like [Trichosurus vulpecula]|uniref:protein FAM170A-like n=1 Tax=Trichosurus vulpecula TaxID=9337 RepID=UPI00186B3478|nr:protein FAM170A-like [Trichosurus vulpecula]
MPIRVKLRAFSFRFSGAVRAEDLVQPAPSGEDRAERQEERETSSPSLYSLLSSSSSSSYHSCVSSLSDSEDDPVSFSYFHVETITAENIAWESDAKLEPIPKRSRMYSREEWEGSILDSSPQNVSPLALFIGKDPTLEGNNKEIEEEKAGTSRDSEKRPELQTPDWTSPPKGAYHCMTCFRIFSTHGALEAHTHHKTRESFSCSIFHPIQERITLQNGVQSENLKRLHQEIQPGHQEDESQSQTVHHQEEKCGEDPFLKSQCT